MSVRSDEIIIRKVTITDLPDLVRLRRMMFKAMGFDDLGQLDAADAAAKNYFAEAIPEGKFVGWLAITNSGVAVGSGGVVIDQRPPGPENLSGQTGYIMNIVTDIRYRRKGISRCIMQVILEWLSEQGIIFATLHASGMGWPLFQELGFVDSNEMRLKIK